MSWTANPNRHQLRGPIRILDSLLDSFRIADTEGEAILLEFRKNEAPDRVVRGVFVFKDAEAATTAYTSLDQVVDRESFDEALRGANFALSHPCLDADDDIVGVYGNVTAIPKGLKDFLSHADGVDPERCIPEKLDGVGPLSAFWAGLIPPEVNILQETPSAPSKPVKVKRRKRREVSDFPHIVGHVTNEVRVRYLRVLSQFHLNVNDHPIPSSDREVMKKIEDLTAIYATGGVASKAPTPAQLRYAKDINTKTGKPFPCPIEEMTRKQVDLYINRNKKLLYSSARSSRK